MDYTTVASSESITVTTQGLQSRNFEPILVKDKSAALEKIKALIPSGASITNGTSRTLEQIGYVDHLKTGQHGWNNLHEQILAEPDPAKQGMLRKQMSVSDFYLGSVHALTQEGELLIASNTGSQLPGIAYNAQNLIFVVGAQKIVPNLSEAFKRLEIQVIPLEDERIRAIYGMGTTHAKTLILHRENPMFGRKVYVIIVQEALGF